MIEKIDLTQLEIEAITSEPMWNDLLAALSEFLQTTVREPLDQLREIRNINENTDPNVILQTLKQLGIDIPFDLIADIERLKKSVYMIPLLYQTSGLESAWNVIAYILGRSINVKTLWTNNYTDFYTEPHGPLRVDGGDWYKTTHVELSMQTMGKDSRIPLPRGQTLKDRLLSAFYSFAPVTLVVERFYFLIEIGGYSDDYFLDGVVHVHKKKLINVGQYPIDEDGNIIHDYTVQGQSVVVAGDSFQYYVTDNGKTIYTSEWGSDKPGIVVFDNTGRATFGAVDSDTVVVIYTTIDGATISKTVQVKKPMRDIRFIEIVGPDVVPGGTVADYSVVVYHENGSEPANVTISTVSPHASVSANRLYADDVLQDEEVMLGAVFKYGGIAYNASKKVVVQRVDPQVYLVDFYVVGPTVVYENNTYKYNAIAEFSDGTKQTVLALWETTSSAVYIDTTGNMTTGLVYGDMDAVLSATFSFRGITKKHSLPLQVRMIENQLVSINVVGPTTIYENKSAKFVCYGTYADNTVAQVDAIWAADYFDMDEFGTLSVGITGSRTKTVTVTARVGGLTATAATIVLAEPVEFQYITISGRDSLEENATTAYRATATFSDGSQIEITPTWRLLNPLGWASINAGGVLTFSNPESGTLDIHASYVYDGITYTQTKKIVCIPKSTIITGLQILGPTVVDANDRIILSAVAAYEDGTIATVTPLWSVETRDSNAEFIAADVVASGIIQGRDVDENMEVVVVAKYFQEVAEHKITVRFIEKKGPDVPISSRIVGPTVFYSGQPASYAQMVKFAHCDEEIMVSSDWEIDVPHSVARIDGNGFITVKGNRNVTMTVTGTYACRGHEISASLVVTSLVADSKYSTLLIHGPDDIEIGKPTPYTAEIFGTDDLVIKGSGTVVPCKWTVASDDLNVNTSDSGLVSLVGPVKNQNLTIRATFDDTIEIVEAIKTIRVRGSRPVFGKGRADLGTATIFAFTDEIPDSGEFNIVLGPNEFGFVCYPVVYGLATFQDVDSGDTGGWDGATWPVDGSVGTTAGPLTVNRNINTARTQWYIYRTEKANLGNRTFRITFT